MTAMTKPQTKGWFAAVATLAALACAAPAYALMYGPIGAPVACPYDDGFTFLVVTCLQAAIEDATYRLLADFSDIMWEPIAALITLQISLFGVHAVMGSSEINKRFFALLLKIGCVVLFADNLGGFAPTIFGIMEEAQRIIIENIGYTGDMECDAAAAAAAFYNSEVWVKMDCILNKLFQYEEPLLLYNAIFALISSALFSGSMGVAVFFMGITMLLNVLGFVFYAVYIFIVAYMYVGFLIIISPLLVPLLLVGVSVGTYERWLYNMMGGIAIPVFVFAYLTITLPVLDHSIFGAAGSLQEVLGDELYEWYRNEQQWCSQQIGTDRDNYRNVPATGGFDYITGPLKNIVTPILSGNTDYCATFGTSSLDFLEDHVEMLMKILDAVLRILITAYLLTTLLKQMPTVAAQIFRGGFGLAKLGMDGLPFESAMRGGMQEGKASMTKAVHGMSGTSGFFSQGLSGATKGISGIFR